MRDHERADNHAGAREREHTGGAPGRRTLSEQVEPEGAGASSPPARPGAMQIARAAVTGAKPGKLPPAVKHAIEREPGAPLPEPAKWAQRVGADVSDVRVVTGAGAEAAAAALEARAFALGHRVFFGRGTSPSDEALLGHELTHVVQQRGAPMPSLDDLQVTSPDDAVEHEARAVEGGSAKPALGSPAALARSEAYTTTAEYIAANRDHLISEVGTRLDAMAGNLTPRLTAPFVSWKPAGAAALIGALKQIISTGAMFGMMGTSAMDALLQPRGLAYYVDRGRLVTRTSQDSVVTGSDAWAPDVATAVADGLVRALGDAVDRVAGRYALARSIAQQKAWAETKTCDPAVTPPAKAEDIRAAHPIDRVIAKTACSSEVWGVDLVGWRAANPALANDATAPRLRKEVTLNLAGESTAAPESPGQWFLWFRAAPADASAEEAALALLGDEAQAHRFHTAAPPLFALSTKMVWSLDAPALARLVAMSPRLAAEQERRKALDDGKPRLIGFMVPRPFHDDPEIADPLRNPTAGLPPALADEAALASSKPQLGPDGKPVATRARDAILAEMGRTSSLLAELETRADRLSVPATTGLAFPSTGLVASVIAKLDQRRTALQAAPDAEVAKWDAQSARQAKIVGEALSGLTSIQQQVDTMLRGAGLTPGPSALDAGAPDLARSSRLPLVRAAIAFANAAASSDLAGSGEALLADAKAKLAIAPAEMMDLVLGEIQAMIASVQGKAGYGAGELGQRELKLREDVAHLRAILLARGDASEPLKKVWADIQDLQTETVIIANLDSLDQAWTAMGDLADSFGVWGAADQRLRTLQGETLAWKAKWSAIRTDWIAATTTSPIDETKKQAVKARFDALRADPALADFLSRAQAAMRDASQRATIARLIALLGIMVVTMGVGALVEGLAAGALGVAAGAEATGATAFAIGTAGVLAESLTFAALNQAFMEKGWDWGNFGHELVENVALFGALRMVSGLLQAAKLGELLGKAPAAGAEMGVQGVALAYGTKLKSEYDLKRKEGRELTDKEKADLLAETAVMFVVGAVMARAGKPLLDKLRGVGGKLGAAIAEANTGRTHLADIAGKASASKSLADLQELMKADRASLQKDIQALEELQRAAADPKARELLKAQGMTDAQLDAIARDLPSGLLRIKIGEALGGAEPIGGDNFALPRDAIGPTMAELQRAGGKLSPPTQDPVTGLRSFEAVFADGTRVRVFEKPPGDVGAVKGAGVYPDNTFVASDGTTKTGRLNAEKVKKALASTAGKELVGGTRTVDATKAVSDTGATFTLRVVEPGGATVDVAVQLVVKPKPDLAPSSAHGGDAGPARLSLARRANGAWDAQVEVSEAMKPEDLEYALRHELNEAAELVRRFPAGEPATGFGAEMQAGVMKAGATTDQPTAHDVATAREVVDLFNAYEGIKSQRGAKPENIAHRQQVLERAMDAAGLKDPSQSKAKLELLRKAGAPDALLRAVENVEVMRVLFEHQAKDLGGATSSLDPALVQHLLYVRPKGDFKNNGLDGGHHTEELLRFSNTSPTYLVREVNVKSAGGAVYRRFQQYRWDGRGPRPTHPDQLPGGSAFDPSLWTLSDQPKTTFDDPNAFLRDAEVGWNGWVSSGRAPGSQRNVTFTSNGVQFGGYVESTAAPYKLSTLFIEASWF